MNHDIMVDLETLGTGHDAPILSIGAVRFNPFKGTTGSEFYITIKMDQGRPIDPATVEWWFKQGPEAQAALFAGKRVELIEALKKFYDFIVEENTKCLWSNGPTFDEDILRNAWDMFPTHPPFPIPYYGSRCVRTTNAIAKMLGLPRTTPKVKHDALEDARAQAADVIEVHRRIIRLSAGETV